MENVEIKVEGMHCDGCVKSVKRMLTGIAGVDKVEVSLAEGKAEVSFDPAKTGVADFKRAVERAGFQASQRSPVAAAPDLQAWHESWMLADGARVECRVIHPEDADIEQDFVRGLSAETKYFRFMAEIGELSPQTLARFVTVHYPQDLALIATIPEGGRDKEIGVARYVAEPGAGTCEFAVTVADAWQQRGVGYRLMRALIGFARAGGLKTMEGFVLHDNRRMLQLARVLGFHVLPTANDPGLRHVVLAL